MQRIRRLLRRPFGSRRALALGLGAAVLAVGLAACSSKPAPSGAGAATTPSPSATPSPEPSASQVVQVVPDPATIGAFSPSTVTVAAGQTVEWVFQGPIPHTVTADDGSYTSLQNPGLANGQTYYHTFTTPGTYTYHCFIHPQMHGTVVVQ